MQIHDTERVNTLTHQDSERIMNLRHIDGCLVGETKAWIHICTAIACVSMVNHVGRYDRR
jgi:hypothetical protein